MKYKLELRLLGEISIISDMQMTPSFDIEKARQFQRNFYFCFTDYAKVVDCVDHNKLWNILKEMGIPDHLTLPPEKSACRSRSES